MAKIINAVFCGGLFATTAKVFQYDVGDKLRFLGVDLPEGYSVDFANSRTGASTTVYGDADGVEIPPEYFIPGTEIYAWIVISDADGHYTRYQAKIPIYERAARSSVEPTPAQADALDEAINALNSAVEDVEDIADGIPDQINAALAEAKESGEFDGPQGPEGPQGPQGESGTPGNSIWRGGAVRASGTTPYYFLSDLSGRTDVSPAAGDLIVSNIFWLWQIKRIVGQTVYLTSLGSIKGETGADGEDGYSPTVTVTEITGGHRVTITDADGDHVFDVMDGQGGGGTSDYYALTNKPSINNVTLTGNKSLSDLGIAAATDVPAAATATPTAPGVAAVGTSTKYAREDHVHPFLAPNSDEVTWEGGDLGQAPAPTDVTGAVEAVYSAIPTVPVQSVNGKTGAVVLNASDVGAGTYSKPSGGIPKSDLASAVQTSLGKADTALQSYTETDPTVPSWAKASSKPAYTASEVGAVAVAQGASHAGEFVVVGSDGNITTVSMSVWQGGSF